MQARTAVSPITDQVLVLQEDMRTVVVALSATKRGLEQFGRDTEHRLVELTKALGAERSARLAIERRLETELQGLRRDLDQGRPARDVSRTASPLRCEHRAHTVTCARTKAEKELQHMFQDLGFGDKHEFTSDEVAAVASGLVDSVSLRPAAVGDVPSAGPTPNRSASRRERPTGHAAWHIAPEVSEQLCSGGLRSHELDVVPESPQESSSESTRCPTPSRCEDKREAPRSRLKSEELADLKGCAKRTGDKGLISLLPSHLQAGHMARLSERPSQQMEVERTTLHKSPSRARILQVSDFEGSQLGTVPFLQGGSVEGCLHNVLDVAAVDAASFSHSSSSRVQSLDETVPNSRRDRPRSRPRSATSELDAAMQSLRSVIGHTAEVMAEAIASETDIKESVSLAPLATHLEAISEGEDDVWTPRSGTDTLLVAF